MLEDGIPVLLYHVGRLAINLLVPDLQKRKAKWAYETVPVALAV
jgi:hypothetical protein